MFITVAPRALAATGLVGFWRFDEGSGTIAGDSSGNGNTGTLYGGATWTVGKSANALDFNGVDGYVQIPQSSSLDVTAQVTVEAWVYPRAYVDSKGYNPHIVSRCDTSGGTIYVLNILGNKVGYGVNPYPDLHLSAVNLTLNDWTYLAMTYNGSYVSLYINGTFDSGYAQSGSILTTSNRLTIGCNSYPATYAYFNGIIDEVRIYNSALIQQEIQADMGESVIFQDDFESYAVGSFPSSGGWQLVYNGAGDQYQVITSNYSASGSQSLQMEGQNGWSAVVAKDFVSNSNLIGFEAFLMGTPGSWPSVGFGNETIQPWGRMYSAVGVDTIDGYIVTGGQNLQQCTTNTWYKIREVMDRNAKTYNVWVNDVLEGINIPEPNNPWEIQSLRFDVGWHNVGNYYDGVKVFEIESSRNIRVPEDYSSVQAAVDAATSGSAITIGPGVYNESVTVNKPLTIIGKLGKEPTFNGSGSGIAIKLLSGANGSQIRGIVITSWVVGVLLNDSSNCMIQDNIVSMMTTAGIALQGSSTVNNIITRNVFQNSAVGIDLSSSSYNNVVYKNIITSNGLGVKVESSGNLVYGNTLAKNGIGISLSSSGSNVVYHNNFVNNTVQASIPTSGGNTWDNGYPSGGNHWSDYNGTDANLDGIGDTPYIIDQNSVDRYPLMQPFNAHDVGITEYSVAKTVVGQGYLLSVEVKILNYGVNDESFPATFSANASTVATQSVALTKWNCTIVALTWNTSGYNRGYYSISTWAWPVQGDNDTANYNCTMGSVLVTFPGDINGDGTVNILDAIQVSNSFLATPGSSNWNPNADINGDNVVNILDAIILANHFLQH
jgi:parallel beta-helix repeat protein